MKEQDDFKKRFTTKKLGGFKMYDKYISVIVNTNTSGYTFLSFTMSKWDQQAKRPIFVKTSGLFPVTRAKIRELINILEENIEMFKEDTYKAEKKPEKEKIEEPPF